MPPVSSEVSYEKSHASFLMHRDRRWRKAQSMAEVVKEAQAETGGVLAVANYLFEKGRVVSGVPQVCHLATDRRGDEGRLLYTPFFTPIVKGRESVFC